MKGPWRRLTSRVAGFGIGARGGAGRGASGRPLPACVGAGAAGCGAHQAASAGAAGGSWSGGRGWVAVLVAEAGGIGGRDVVDAATRVASARTDVGSLRSRPGSGRPRRSWTTCWALGRSAGSLARQRRTTSASAGGTAERSGSAYVMRWTTATMCGASNGASPVAA